MTKHLKRRRWRCPAGPALFAVLPVLAGNDPKAEFPPAPEDRHEAFRLGIIPDLAGMQRGMNNGLLGQPR
jgi:hypothetical protein